MFGTKWAVYKTTSGAHRRAAGRTRRSCPKGLKGNVDTVAGMRLTAEAGLIVGAARPGPSPVAGGPATTAAPRRGPARAALGACRRPIPARSRRPRGLYPNQILTAYGIAPLQAAGLQGQGARLAIVGEAPTPAVDVNTFRSCFGAQGTALQDPQRRAIKPILESSLDAMVVSMVAPQLDALRPLGPPDRRGRRRRRRRSASSSCSPRRSRRRRTARRCPTSISVSYGVCESIVSPYTASRTLVERQLTADGGAGHHDRRRGRRHRVVGVRARRAGRPAHLVATRSRRSSWPRQLAVGAGGRRHEPDARTSNNTIASTGAVERHRLPGAVHRDGGRRRRAEHLRDRARGGSPRSRSRARSTGWSPTSRPSRTRAPATRSSARAASRAAPGPARASPSSAAPARPRRSWRA